jgi:hypothetical protein
MEPVLPFTAHRGRVGAGPRHIPKDVSVRPTAATQ